MATSFKRGLLALCILLCASTSTASHEANQRSSDEAAWTDSTLRAVRSADGVSIQYRIYGEGDPAVILVHGWSCDSSYWSAQFDALKERYTVLAVDLAGHGESGRNRRHWSMEAFGEDVVAVARQVFPRRVLLVGHSMGGVVALEAAARLGDRAIGVITVDTFRDVGQPPMKESDIERFLEPFRRDFFDTTRKVVMDLNFTSRVNPILAHRIADEMASAPPEIAIQSAAARFRHDFDALLRRSKAPLVVINAAYAGPTQEARIRAVAPAYRHAVIFDDTAHFPMIEQPERFNAVLLKEISYLVGGGLN
jgi:pimeloyl-ACP methyl ester carboxylesterase